MVSVFDYVNPTQGLLCNERIEQFNKHARDLNLKYSCAKDIVTNTAGVVQRNINDYRYSERSIPSMDSIIDLDSLPNSTGGLLGVAECLTSEMPFKDELSSLSSGFGKIISGVGAIYKDVVNKVMETVSKITGGLKQAAAWSLEKIKMVINKIEKAFDAILDPVSNVMFKAMDKLNNFLSDIDISSTLSQIEKFTDCLTSNCGNSRDLMTDISGVVQGSIINLPIDRYTGEFRPYKLLNTDGLDSSIREKTSFLDKDFISLNNKKVSYAEKAAEKIRELL